MPLDGMVARMLALWLDRIREWEDQEPKEQEEQEEQEEC